MRSSIIFWSFLFLAPSFLLTGTVLSKDNLSKQFVQPSPGTIRVMTFNLRLDTPSDGPNAWPHRKEMVAHLIRFHRADFVGIQEGLIHQLKYLDEALPYFGRIGVGRTDGAEGGEFSALFYRKDRFELLDHATFWLSETPEEPGSMGWDAAFPRIVTWGKFRDRSNGRSFFVFNTHFDHRGETAREESAKLILRKMKEIAGDSPAVLSGDFNVTEDRQPYKIITESVSSSDTKKEKLSDSFYHSKYGHLGPISTWDGFEEIASDRRIDYIFTNPGFEVIQHATLADQQNGRFPSDHLPVAVDIEFAK